MEDDDVETTEATEETPTEESPHYSLHAIAGVCVNDTLQLPVSLGDISLIALLDTGSTHNFISEGATQQTGLPLQRRPRLTATVANG